MSIHDGHRARMKQRFIDHGEQAFNDDQLLELLLFYSVPQGDVTPLAHQLMNHFGSLAGVLDATMEELQQVKGVGAHTALLLTMLPQLVRRYELSRSRNDAVITSSADAGEYLLPYFFGTRNETAYLLSLDGKGQVLNCDLLAEGSLDRVDLDYGQVIDTAQTRRATSVILAHNHISGLATPSQEDVHFTLVLRAMLRTRGIHLLDHLVIADDDFISMAESGFFNDENANG